MEQVPQLRRFAGRYAPQVISHMCEKSRLMAASQLPLRSYDGILPVWKPPRYLSLVEQGKVSGVMRRSASS